MLDLEVVIVDGDALDDQLQECLAVGDARALHARAGGNRHSRPIEIAT